MWKKIKAWIVEHLEGDRVDLKITRLQKTGFPLCAGAQWIEQVDQCSKPGWNLVEATMPSDIALQTGAETINVNFCDDCLKLIAQDAPLTFDYEMTKRAFARTGSRSAISASRKS